VAAWREFHFQHPTQQGTSTMRIVFVQTTIVIDDLPEETKQSAWKPDHPFTLLEKLCKAAEPERESTPKPQERRFHGTFLT
jgi:hypothetical protein